MTENLHILYIPNVYVTFLKDGLQIRRRRISLKYTFDFSGIYKKYWRQRFFEKTKQNKNKIRRMRGWELYMQAFQNVYFSFI